ncbi:MAG TPA: NADH-quinone oxidoreductase subunit J [Actinomycetales bacterium]|nr:NADH-quinone oxidoreductase subunit J [Actinomycetales bacterium]
MTDLSIAAEVAPALLTETGEVGGGEVVLFWILAPIMVLAALGLIFVRRAVHAAFMVIIVMISLAFLYTAQDAPFLGVAQVVVYTGAVMMLFLFVLMLVGVDASDSLVETLKGQRWIGYLLGLGLAAVLVGVITSATMPRPTGLDAANADTNPVGLARLVFGDWVFTFELAGVLLVIAAVGALVVTHRQRIGAPQSQKERADRRVLAAAAGEVPLTPLPAPGVYARSNAVDTPALDHTGRPIEDSVSRVLRIRGQERGIDDLASATVDVHEAITGESVEESRAVEISDSTAAHTSPDEPTEGA